MSHCRHHKRRGGANHGCSPLICPHARSKYHLETFAEADDLDHECPHNDHALPGLFCQTGSMNANADRKIFHWKKWSIRDIGNCWEEISTMTMTTTQLGLSSSRDQTKSNQSATYSASTRRATRLLHPCAQYYQSKPMQDGCQSINNGAGSPAVILPKH